MQRCEAANARAEPKRGESANEALAYNDVSKSSADTSDNAALPARQLLSREGVSASVGRETGGGDRIASS
jgi:hypothetical protein